MAVEKKTTNQGNKGELAYKRLTDSKEKLLAFLNDSSKAELIDDKVVIYKMVLTLLNQSIKLFLRQNLNTYTNKLYFDVLRKGIRATKTEYGKRKVDIINSYKGENKYKYQIQKMNDLIAEVEELARITKKGTDKANVLSEKVSAITQNLTLRPRVELTIDLLPTITEERKEAIRAKHVSAIYSNSIKPILEWLLKEGVIDQTKADKVQQSLLNIAKNGYLPDDDNKLNAKIFISYWPKEVVLGAADKFGYKGNIWLMYKEVITLEKKSAEKKEVVTSFDSSTEYVENFRLILGGEKSKKNIFYPSFINKILEDHKSLHKNLSGLFDDIGSKLKEKGASKEQIGEIQEVIIGNTYIYTPRRVGGKNGYLAITVERRKDVPVEEVKAPEVKKEKKVVEPKSKVNMPKELEDL